MGRAIKEISLEGKGRPIFFVGGRAWCESCHDSGLERGRALEVGNSCWMDVHPSSSTDLTVNSSFYKPSTHRHNRKWLISTK